jgi:hypothetical protein
MKDQKYRWTQNPNLAARVRPSWNFLIVLDSGRARMKHGMTIVD